NNARVVGPTVQFSSGTPNREVYVVGDNGANSNINTPRGGVIARLNDQNPERIVVTNLFQTLPNLSVSDTFTQPIVGIMDYNFGKFLLHATTIPPFVSGNLPREVTPLTPGPNELTIGNFNVENLDPTDPITKFNNLASLIVVNMKAPDVISIQEIQDNNGATDNGVVDASLTWNTLITAVQNAGGPTYIYRQIDPVNDQDGGEPGGNIRQGFLFRTDRGLTFVDRPGGNSTNSNTVQNVAGQPQLLFSPGRLDPLNAAFNSSRKPLAAEFLYNGRTLFLIANHFNSKGGDDPLFGKNQPPVQSSQVQRNQQAAIVANFVSQIFAINSNALVMVLGDLNDFEYSAPLTLLRNVGLTPMLETLPVAERYSYDFTGNSQSLDHQFASASLLAASTSYDAVHVNSEFVVQDSDHDPEVGYFLLPVGGTATPTNTPIPPTNTLTNTPTNTVVPPTSTFTNTPTNTSVPPTSTVTNTPTNTAVPPTATSTSTNTAVPPTATSSSTSTNTAVPPTATRTNTTIPTNTPSPT
ncbi:MAG: nuclease, partial [Chloroflexia bacterium]